MRNNDVPGLYPQKLVALAIFAAVVALTWLMCGRPRTEEAAPTVTAENPASKPAPTPDVGDVAAPVAARGPMPLAGNDAPNPSTAAGDRAQAPAATAAPRGRVLVEGESRSASAFSAPAGSLDKDAIQAAIQAVKPTVAECYEKALKHDPDLSGRVVVEFTIEAVDGGGGVTAGEVTQTEMNAPFFEACVLKEIVAVPFPAPEGGGVVKVSYPFHFESHAD